MTTLLARLRLLVLRAAALLAAMTLAASASAGALQVRDEAHVLSAESTSRLRSLVASMPFDARLVVTNEYADAQDLARYVGSLVNERNLVAVGVDPQHHHVQIHYGTGSQIPRSEWPAIDRAGNDAFRRGDWEAGVAAIFRLASASAANAVGPNARDAAPVEAARTSLIGPGTLLLIVAGAIGLAVFFARRRSQYGSMGGGYGAPPYRGPGYGQQPGGGMGPLGGGLIGAGLGGLAGYELGKLEGEREGHDRGQVADVGGSDVDRGGGGFDAGGGGSSWGDDGGGFGGDGGGGDMGGGGSDF
jgi:hypothetical protein